MKRQEAEQIVLATYQTADAEQKAGIFNMLVLASSFETLVGLIKLIQED